MKKALKTILITMAGLLTILLGIGIVNTILFKEDEYFSDCPEWDDYY